MGAYIYQNEKWPDFAWSAKAISGQLAAVSRQQGRLVGRMEGMSMAFREEAVLEALTEEITQSSEIEGETLDREQIRSSLPAAGNGRSANPCAVAIDDAPQDLEQVRHAMDLVEDNEFVLVGREVEFGLGQSRAIGIGFKVEVDGRTRLADLDRKRRLANLPGPQQSKGRTLGQTLDHLRCDTMRRSIIPAFLDFHSNFAWLFCARGHA